MRTITCGITILMLVSLPRHGFAQTVDTEPGVTTPHWLTGCWEMSAGNLVVAEHWMAVLGGAMLGMSRTVRGDQLAGYELLLLREEESGWVYEAHPSGQPAASFRSSTVTDTSIVFSNPAHDFPQTIAYFKIRSDSLIATIAGEQGDQFSQIEFRYRSVACPASG